MRRSPRKNAKVPDCSDSEQQDDVQEDLFYTDHNIHLDDSPANFEETTKGVTDKASQTGGFNKTNTLEIELKRMKHSVNVLGESYDKKTS